MLTGNSVLPITGVWWELLLSVITAPPLLGSIPWHHHQNPSLMATCRARRAQRRQHVSPSILIHSLRFFLHYIGVIRYIIIHLSYLFLLATWHINTHIKYAKEGTKNFDLLILTSLLLIQFLF